MAYIKIGNIEIDNINLAITKEEKQKGLMYKTNPEYMLFVFSSPVKNKFWMKDTPCPLDIIFCSKGKVIHIAQGTPYDESLVGPDQEYSFVLEAPASFCKHNNICVGQEIKVML